MSYGIMRIEKRKAQACYGLEQENNRSQDRQRNFTASDIEWELTNENHYFIKAENWKQTIDTTIKSKGITKYRKDAIVMLDGLYTASPEYLSSISQDEIKQYFKDCLEFHQNNYGIVINAVIHYDEKTPHMHVCSIPLIEKDDKWKLTAKEIMGTKSMYHQRQNEFYEQVTKKYGLERGEIKSPENQREHLTVLQYKNNVLKQENKELKKELEEKVNELTILEKYIKTLVKKIDYIKEWLKFEKQIDDDLEIELKKYKDRDTTR